jgi:hypothetical protein
LEQQLAQRFVSVVAPNPHDQVPVPSVERADLDPIGLVGNREELADVLRQLAGVDAGKVGCGDERRGGCGSSGVGHVPGVVEYLPPGSGGVCGFG